MFGLSDLSLAEEWSFPNLLFQRTGNLNKLTGMLSQKLDDCKQIASIIAK